MRLSISRLDTLSLRACISFACIRERVASASAWIAVVMSQVFWFICAERLAIPSLCSQQQFANWLDRFRPSVVIALFSAKVESHIPLPMLVRRSLIWPKC